NVFRSVMVQRIVPAGDWIDALPACTALSTLPRTRRSTGLCCRVNTHPWMVALPTPENVVPLQQKRYCPVIEFHSRIMLGSLSSWSATSKVVTVIEHVAVLPAVSVAVQTTVVTPIGKHEPEGGLHAT